MEAGGGVNDSQGEEDEDGNPRNRVLDLKPKITMEHVEYMKLKQDEDLFENIYDIKSQVMMDHIREKPIVR
jgi:hypothetical protein